MSVRLAIDSISNADKQKISKDLQFENPSTKQYVSSYDVEGEEVIIPYAYARINLGVSSPPRNAYPTINYEFKGELRDYQIPVQKEAIAQLNKKGACLLSLHVGWGKSILGVYLATRLKLKTLIIINKLMLVDQWKEEVNQNTNSKCQMLTPKTKRMDEKCDVFIMNAINIPKMPKGFFDTIGTCIVDECLFGDSEILMDKSCMPIKQIYDSMRGSLFHHLRGDEVKLSMVCQTFNVKRGVFELKRIVGASRRPIHRPIVCVSFEKSNQQIKCTDNHRFLTTDGYVEVQYLTHRHLVITREFGINAYKVLNDDQRQVLIGSLLSGRAKVVDKKISITLSPNLRSYSRWKATMFGVEFMQGSTFHIATPPDMELNYSSIVQAMDARALAVWYQDMDARPDKIMCVKYLGIKDSDDSKSMMERFVSLGVECLILNSSTVEVCYDSFMKAVGPFLHSSVPNAWWGLPYPWDTDFKIYGLLRVESIQTLIDHDEEYVYDIETEDNHNFVVGLSGIVVHNCHLVLAEKLFKAMFKITPKYVIGLSATPYRPDGLNALLDLYFGPDKIIKKLFRPHTVYTIHTGIQLKYDLQWNGDIDWNSVLNNQACHAERNQLIVDIVKKFSVKTFLVLCKRVTHAETLVEMLADEHVTFLYGSKKEYDQNARIIVATGQKCGVGFNNAKLNALLLASDMQEYFIQYLGRVFRTPDVKPIVFDLVDNLKSLKTHYQTRKQVYRESGGDIKEMSANDFKIIPPSSH